MFNSPSSSSSSSSSEGRQGRSPTPNPFRRSNASRQHQSARANQVSPDSHQSRVRRSRSLQLPEKRSPGASGAQREHPRESNEAHRVVVKIVNDRGSERSKRHALQNSEYYISRIFRDINFRRYIGRAANILWRGVWGETCKYSLFKLYLSFLWENNAHIQGVLVSMTNYLCDIYFTYIFIYPFFYTFLSNVKIQPRIPQRDRYLNINP